jgi:hypothetical protein
MVSLDNFEKKILFTIVLDYKKKNYIYQCLATNEREAKLNWAKTIDLCEIGVHDIKTIRSALIMDALDEDFYPSPLEELRSVWSASGCASNFGDEENFAVANIIATISSKKYTSDINKNLNLKASQ